MYVGYIFIPTNLLSTHIKRHPSVPIKFGCLETDCVSRSVIMKHLFVILWRVEGRINQYVVVNLHREFRYGVTTADEGLRPILPSKLKYPPHPSDRRY